MTGRKSEFKLPARVAEWFLNTGISPAITGLPWERFQDMSMLLLATAVKLIAEIALMALLGQWLVGLLAGAGRDGNFFYRLLGVLTGPFVRLARVLSPRSGLRYFILAIRPLSRHS